MNARPFWNRLFGSPIRSTYSSLREPKPIAMPGLKMHNVQARAIDSHENPI